jgi:DNA polymerase I-like protein with 3'-5' exonuclease and polymerase domains
MPEVVQQLKPIVLSELNPPLSVTVVKDVAGLQALKKFLDIEKIIGIDTETSCVNDFWFRRVRTVQIGNREKQFVIDLLAFAGSEDKLVATQGNYGANAEGVYQGVLDVLGPVLDSKEWLKCGVNLAFDYETLRWNFGLRMWNIFSCDLAERVIQAGTISLKQYAEFSMAAMTARYFGLELNKELQTSFDLKTSLTQSQLEYAAFDTRMPLAIRQAQVNVMTKDQLLAVAQIENDAVPSYVDMHLNGQRIDTAKWMLRIDHAVAQQEEELRLLDEYFIPIVGRKNEQLDDAELARRYKHWQEGFQLPTQQETDFAVQKRLEKDKTKKAEIGGLLKAEEKKRAEEKAKARKHYSELSKKHTEVKHNIEKCDGNAYLNFKSQPQMLEALSKLPGMKNITDVSDDTLLRFNDRPIIQTLRKYRTNGKTIGTYGAQWTQRWITKPCKVEGWLHPGDGRLHCLFNQLEADTGRSSSSKPNAQNLPAEEEVRDCFIADEGEDLITIDMSGCELRIIAEMAQAQSWIQAFAKNQDVHSLCTEILYPERWREIALLNCAYYALGADGQPKRVQCECPEHKKLRKHAKALNFGLCYGAGPAKLADELGISLEAAKDLMRLHEEKFPDIWSFLKSRGAQAKEYKEARDMFGRRRTFPEPTWATAREWFIDNRGERLELDEASCIANIFQFKAKNLREPNEDEHYKLTHRSPTEGEIKQGFGSMMGSIERQGKNMPIQGTNASICKRAMGNGFDAEGQPYLWHLLQKYGARLLSMIHDELLIACPKAYSKEVAELASGCFRRAAAEVMKSVEMKSTYMIAEKWSK